MEWALLLIALAGLAWLISVRLRTSPTKSPKPLLIADRRLVDSMLHNSSAVVTVASYTPSGQSTLELSSPMLLRLLELSENQVLGRSWEDVLGPTAGAQAQREDLQVLAAGSARAFVTRMGVRGHRRTLMATKFPLEWPGLRAVGMVALDVTDHRRRDRLMRLSFDLSPVPMARLAIAGTQSGPILDANEALGRLLEVSAEDLRGQDLGRYLLQPGQSWPQTVVEDDAGSAREVRIKTHEGRSRWVALTISTVGGELDEEPFALAVLEDVTGRHQAQTELTHQAHHDALTGLPNRYALQRELSTRLRALSGGSDSLAVLFCDLDGFKTLNDTLSHRVGDQVLVDVARRLRDAVGRHDTVARLGGDEFVVIAHPVSDEAEAVEIGQRLCTSISAPFEVEGRTVGLGLSVGVTVTADPHASGEDLLRQADLAMYRAKENGRNRVETYVAALQTAAIGRMQVEEHLRSALAAGTVAVKYQPIVSLDGARVSAVEALARIPSPVTTSAAAFIEVAEQTGLISALGEQIMRRVGEDLRSWGEDGAYTRVHLNVSRSQLLDPGFPAQCVDAFAAGIPAGQVCFEVSDSTALADSDTVVEALWNLRGLGFHVGIDGFGAGRSGLTSLRRIPADYLKIDRSFITQLATAREDQVIVAAIVRAAHDLGRRVIATGVESEDQVDVLRRLGCDEVQGYLHSPAVAAGLVPDFVLSMSQPANG